jgi:hypothetical protein
MPTDRELLSWASESLQWAETVADPDVRAGIHRMAAEFVLLASDATDGVSGVAVDPRRAGRALLLRSSSESGRRSRAGASGPRRIAATALRVSGQSRKQIKVTTPPVTPIHSTSQPSS